MSQWWFKFQPSSWRSAPELRMCSLAARGLWIDMLCLMHESEPRGYLKINGKDVSLKQLSGLCGVPISECESYLNELEEAGVFTREGVEIFSRRMVRDEAKNQKDKDNGKSGGNPNLAKGVNGGVNPLDNHESNPTVNPPSNPKSKSKSNILSSSLRSEDNCDSLFSELMQILPKRKGDSPKNVRKAFDRAMKTVSDFSEVRRGAIAYAESRKGEDRNYNKGLEAWFNGEMWQSDWTPSPKQFAQPRGSPTQAAAPAEPQNAVIRSLMRQKQRESDEQLNYSQ